MLAPFIIEHRAALIAQTRERVAARKCPQPTEAEIKNGIPTFLDQLVAALQRASPRDDTSDHAELDRTAGLHGDTLFALGLTIGQVVHDYGDICQSITEMAIRTDAVISNEDFQTLNLCLDQAIAGAVTAYAARREHALAENATERLGILAHELRNQLNVATLSFDAIKSGRVAAGGTTGTMHARSLVSLRRLIDRSLADVRLDASLDRHERVSVAELIEEVEIGGILQAQARDLHLAVSGVGNDVAVVGDRQILAAALSNLLANAFKFTPVHGKVSLSTRFSRERVLFDVEDECGGLPPGKAEDLFRPYSQRGPDRTGLGLGLAICRRAAEASGGAVSVRDLPGKGCVFTLTLPIAPRTLPLQTAK